MLLRVLKGLLLSMAVIGMAYGLVCMHDGGPRGSIASILLSSGGQAHAQNPGAQLRYDVVVARSEARYRIREQLAGFNFPNDAVATTRAIDGSITFDGQGEGTVQARTAFRFGDFGLSIPRVSSVLSVEDDIRLETDLLLRRSV
jgi:hypothetical protein